MNFFVAKFMVGLTKLLVKACGFQVCQCVAFVPGGDSSTVHYSILFQYSFYRSTIVSTLVEFLKFFNILVC